MAKLSLSARLSLLLPAITSQLSLNNKFRLVIFILIRTLAMLTGPKGTLNLMIFLAESNLGIIKKNNKEFLQIMKIDKLINTTYHTLFS